ncbi:hypothetical protein ACJZ2D_015277 [Fusarium nematophilum]
MHGPTIQAWIHEVADLTSKAALASPKKESKQSHDHPTRKRKRALVLQDAGPSRINSLTCAMSSPKRLPGLSIDLDAIPRPRIDDQPAVISSADVSSFVTTLRNGVFSPSPRKKRRPSPSKRHPTTGGLAQLKRPIRVINPEEMTSALPPDGHGLYHDLFAV